MRFEHLSKMCFFVLPTHDAPFSVRACLEATLRGTRAIIYAGARRGLHVKRPGVCIDLQRQKELPRVFPDVQPRIITWRVMNPFGQSPPAPPEFRQSSKFATRTHTHTRS